MKIKHMLLAGLLMASTSFPTRAENLRVAFDTEWTSLDPHFHSFPYNISVARAMFDALTDTDAQLKPRPGLATWEARDALTWVFHLAPAARFSDGAPVTAQDAIASLARVPKVPNSPGPLTPYVRGIVSAEAPDAKTLVLRMAEPAPFLPALLANVAIIPARLAEATSAQFNTGEALVGSGPFRFARYARSDRLELVRNEAAWGARPAWDRVEIRVVTNAAAREAALLARDVDFILNPAPSSVAVLASNKAVLLHKVASTRITYLQFNQSSTVYPDMKGTNGRNPFADARVRRAVDLVIPREAITSRVLEGLGVPAGQIIAPGQFGFAEDLAVERADPVAAKKLLADAGWESGFDVALSTPGDRNLNGTQVAQAIAGALTRIGIRTTVNAVPLEVYLSGWRKNTFSMILHGAGPQPVAALLLPQMVGTKDPKTALGVSNESGYGNAALDAIMRGAFAEIDDAKRAEGLRAAARIIRRETAIVPLHHEFVLWASRPGLAFAPRMDSLTFVQDVVSTQ